MFRDYSDHRQQYWCRFNKIAQCEGLRAAAKAYSNQSVMNIEVIL